MSRPSTGPGGGVAISGSLPTEEGVPTTRTINGHPLSSDVVLVSSDLGAIDVDQKGAADGVCELEEGLVPESRLPIVALSTKGDLVVYSGTDTVRLPVGSDGQHLVARPGSAVGVAWETAENAVSVDGSIFSLVGALGGANARVVYDFTRYDPAKTLAQNLQGANVAGDGRLHLGPNGTPIYGPSAKYVLGGIQPRSVSSQGGALWTDSNAMSNAATNLGTTDNDLRFLGPMTMEILVNVLQVTSTNGDQCQLVAMWAAGETEGANYLYSLRFDVATGPVYTLTYAAEHGAGVNITAQLCQVPTPVGAGLLHLVLTRDALGKVIGYVQGRRVCGLTTPVDSGDGGVILPTMGATPISQLQIGVQGTENTTRCLFYAVKLLDYQYSDAQVQESYRRTFFGPGEKL